MSRNVKNNNSIKCDVALDSLDLSIQIEGPAFGINQSSLNISKIDRGSIMVQDLQNTYHGH
jgi:hypothetical protein